MTTLTLGTLRRSACSSDHAAKRGTSKARGCSPRLRISHIAVPRYLPYNAHTTTSYALLARFPVLSCAGLGFPARVAGTQLNALDLGELMMRDLEEYEAVAFELATDPARLRA